jgi:hypothetical protein
MRLDLRSRESTSRGSPRSNLSTASFLAANHLGRDRKSPPSPARLELTTDGTGVVGRAGAALLKAASPGQAATTSAGDRAQFHPERTSR